MVRQERRLLEWKEKWVEIDMVGWEDWGRLFQCDFPYFF